MNRLYKCPGVSNVELKDQIWNNGRFNWAPDCEMWGKNIFQTKSRREDCGGLCAIHLECTHFTWESNGICTLKTAPKLSPETRPLKGALCGYVTTGNSDFQWTDRNKGQEKVSNDCDFPGNDIRNAPVKKAAECFSLCISEPKCTNYVIRSLTGSVNDMTCFLKTGKNPIATQEVDVKNSYCGMITARI